MVVHTWTRLISWRWFQTELTASGKDKRRGNTFLLLWIFSLNRSIGRHSTVTNMRDKVKLFFAMLAIGTFTCVFLYKMVNRQNRILTSDSEILLSIFGERNNATGLLKSCQKNTSRLFGFSKWLFTWDTCEPIRNNKSPWFVERSTQRSSHSCRPSHKESRGKTSTRGG